MLQALLKDISTNKFQHEELGQVFDKVAIELLRKTKIVSGLNEYLIKEIEFYLYSDHYKHLDPYVHGKNECHPQLKFGRWYFHRLIPIKIKEYQNIRRKGVDITFGSEQHNNFGGILIRKIEKSNTTITGIGNIVTALINDTRVSEFEKFVHQDISVFDSNALLRLEYFPNSLDKAIFKGPRKGLNQEKDNECLFFRKDYNYFNDIEYKLVAK